MDEVNWMEVCVYELGKNTLHLLVAGNRRRTETKFCFTDIMELSEWEIL